jgi:phosphate transport system protein
MAAESTRLADRVLLTADLALAERVLSGDSELDHARQACEESAQSLLALQSPVAETCGPFSRRCTARRRSSG